MPKKVSRHLREERSTWALQDAKARLSEVVRRARREGPQRVTTRGADPVVVLSEEEYERLKGANRPKRKLSDVLASSPIGELKIERDQDFGRDIDLS